MFRAIMEFYSACYKLSRTNTLLFFILYFAPSLEVLYSFNLSSSYKTNILRQLIIIAFSIVQYAVTVVIIRKYNDCDINEKTNYIKIIGKTIAYVLRIGLLFGFIIIPIVFVIGGITGVYKSLLSSTNYKMVIDITIILITIIFLLGIYKYIYVFNIIITSNGNTKYKGALLSSKTLILNSKKETLSIYLIFSSITLITAIINILIKGSLLLLLTTSIANLVAGLIVFARINQIYKTTTTYINNSKTTAV